MLIYNQVQILLLGYVYSCIHAGRIIEINKNTKRNVWIVPLLSTTVPQITICRCSSQCPGGVSLLRFPFGSVPGGRAALLLIPYYVDRKSLVGHLAPAQSYFFQAKS